jgi:hypothetical protein
MTKLKENPAMQEQQSHERSAARLLIAPAIVLAAIFVVLNLVVLMN